MTTENNQQVQQVSADVDTPSMQKTLPSSAVRATMSGDWNGVSDADRMRFLKHMCDALSIPLVLNPFKFISMKGKTVLYSTAEAAFSLARKNKMTVKVTEERFDKESQILTVKVTATHPKGEQSDDVGKIYLGGLSGQDRANAEMKAVTKAKRRAIFSALGLSVMDEDEIKHLRNLDHNETPQQHNELEDIPQVEEVKGTDEDQQARFTLFDDAVGENGVFEANTAGFEKFIKDEYGKRLQELNAAECEELGAKLQNVAEGTDNDGQYVF